MKTESKAERERRRLTERLVELAEPPELESRASARMIADAGQPGLYLQVAKSGTKSWLVRYTFEGRRHAVSLGRWPAVSLAEARRRALVILSKVQRGEDPKAEAKAPTVAELVAKYLDFLKDRQQSLRDTKRRLGLLVARHGSLRITAVTASQLQSLIDAKAEEGARTEATRLRAALSAFFSWAWRRGYVEQNPARRTRGFPEPPPRTRVLSPEEWDRLANAVAAEKDPFAQAAFLLLMATGARLSEVLRARWEDLDLDRGEWVIPRAKSGRREVIPLPEPVVEALRALPRVGTYVIPGRWPNRPRQDLKKPWLRLCARAGIEGAGIHDIRRTVGRILADQFGLEVASKALRHTDIRVTTAHYTPLSTERIRTALATVLPLKRKKKS
ncbi:Prophage integrase IntA [bacterium HR09]|nr:Prophage integrase IntA [bacterium HR09]